MKITLEPTIDPPREGIPSPTVSVSYPDDDMTCFQVVADLVVPALQAAGYNKEGIVKAFQTVFKDHKRQQDT